MTFTLTGRLICRDAAEAETVRGALPEHVRLTRAEPGCITFDVTPDASDPLVFLVSEAFEDRAAFDAHQMRTHASEWYRLTCGIRRAYHTSETDTGTGT